MAAKSVIPRIRGRMRSEGTWEPIAEDAPFEGAYARKASYRID